MIPDPVCAHCTHRLPDPDHACDWCGYDRAAVARDRAHLRMAAAQVQDVAIDVALSAIAAIGLVLTVIAIVISLAWLLGVLDAIGVA